MAVFLFKPLPQPLPETERGVLITPHSLSGKGAGGLGYVSDSF